MGLMKIQSCHRGASLKRKSCLNCKGEFSLFELKVSKYAFRVVEKLDRKIWKAGYLT